MSDLIPPKSSRQPANIPVYQIPPSFQIPPILPQRPIKTMFSYPEVELILCTNPPLPTMAELPINKITYLTAPPLAAPPLRPFTIRELLLNPKSIPANVMDLKMVNPLSSTWEMIPAHLPDLSDLVAYPPTLLLLLNWALSRNPWVEPKEVVPEELQFLLDPSPVFHPLREICLLNSTSKEIKMASHTNTVKMIRPVKRYRQIEIWASWSPPSSTKYRMTSLTFTATNKKLFSNTLNREIDVLDPGSPRAQDELVESFLVPGNMIILSWNCRGIARPTFNSHFRHLCHTHKPDIVILTETRVSSPNSTTILSKLDFDSHEILEPQGFSEGIIILWNKKDADVTVVNKGQQIVNVVVQVPIQRIRTRTLTLLTRLWISS